MSSEVTTTSGGLVVVTQVFPSNQPQPQEVQLGSLRTQRFIRAYPLAVGTVQIMIGVLVFLSGLVMVPRGLTLEVYSGFFVWGAGCYITSGSLTVAAGKSLSRSLIKTTLGFNVVSMVSASAAINLYALDVVIGLKVSQQYDVMVLSSGFPAVLLVFHVLEFAVSITVIAFASRAICSCCDDQQQPYICYTPAQAPPLTEPATMTLPPQQTPSSSKPAEDQNQILCGLSEPPRFTD